MKTSPIYCEWCGDPIPKKRKAHHAHYCSDECKNAFHNKGKLEFPMHKIASLYIENELDLLKRQMEGEDVQTSLFGVGPTIKPLNLERFEKFDIKNPHIYKEIKRRVKIEKALGATRIGMKWIVEEMRRDSNLHTTGEIYKFDNTFTRHYVDKYILEYPEDKDLFYRRAA